MFSVIFEVQPKAERWDAYLGIGKMLRPELEQIDGFIENVRYRSLTRPGWLLSVSDWRDEKSLVRWRTAARHHDAQARGRAEIFVDYQLRVGQLTRHSGLSADEPLPEQRLDETQVGDGTTLTLIDTRADAMQVATIGSSNAVEQAIALGLPADDPDVVAWDVFDAVLSPGDRLLLITWRNEQAAQRFEQRLRLAPPTRRRQARVIRQYGMRDRREAPQYWPTAPDA